MRRKGSQLRAPETFICIYTVPNFLNQGLVIFDRHDVLLAVILFSIDFKIITYGSYY